MGNDKEPSEHRFGTSDHQRPPHHKHTLDERKQWGTVLTRALGGASRLVIEGVVETLSRMVQLPRLLRGVNAQ